MKRPLIKVCGVTTVDDAAAAAELGADLIGLNFWPGSPRVVDVDTGRRLVAAIGGRARVVGVFVDATAAEIAATALAVGLDIVQPHGNEPAALALELEALGAPRMLRAIRLPRAPSAEDLEEWPKAWGFLFDHYDPVRFGGTGEAWDWGALRLLSSDRPRFVAGGIRPGRAKTALVESGADGVDVCSGVESRPGIKDHEAMARLIAEVRDVSIVAPA